MVKTSDNEMRIEGTKDGTFEKIIVVYFLPTSKDRDEKYQIVYKDLEKAIHCQKYQVGDFLPTEQELVETFKVSRYTIRKALSLLVE